MFTRVSTLLLDTHDALLGQPPTSGGSNSAWPMPAPDCAIDRESCGASSARARWTMTSVGDFTSDRYATG